MAVRPRLGIRGLYTNPNPLGAPDGALLEASEVVLRRPGLAEPRPGFKLGDASSLASIYGLLPLGSSLSTLLRVGPAVLGGSTTYSGTSGTTPVYDGNQTSPTPAALQWDRDAIRGCEVRSTLYLTTKDACRRITTLAAMAQGAGAFPANILSAAYNTDGAFLPDTYSVSYRLVYVAVSPYGLETQSAPSGQFVVYNNAGGARGITFDFSWIARWGAGLNDVIRVYRSEVVPGNTDPQDIHYQIAEIKVSSTTADPDGGSGTGTFIDKTSAEDATTVLGAALYTNSTATNGGAEATALRPPAAGDLTLYQGSLFWSNLTDYARKIVSWESTSNIGTTAGGVGYRSRTGTRTNGSATITGLSSVTELKVGMLLSSAPTPSWSGTDPVRITAIVGSDLTMSATYTGVTDGAPASLIFCDSICIGDTSVGTNYHRADFANYLIESVNRGLATTLGRQTKSSVAFAYAIGCVASPQTSRTYTVAFESFDAITGFSISATHGSDYNPPLPEPSATAETVSPTSASNMVGWSDRDLPEQRRLASRSYVGNGTPILRSIATKDAVWHLKGKGDGIYRQSGMGQETGFRLDLFDADTYLLHPNLACRLGETVYAWTNNGLVAIDDGGVRPISDPVIGVDTHALEVALDHSTGNDLACFAVANPKDNEVIFGLPQDDASASPDAAERTYVLNTLTGGLSQWFVSNTTNRCMAYDNATRALLIGRNDSGTYRVERLPSETYVQFADREFSLTISDITDDVVTLSGAVSGWTPAIGDLVRVGTDFAIITATNDSTHFTVHDGTAIATGAGTAYEGFTARVRWNPETLGMPPALKRMLSTVVHLEDTYGVEHFTTKVDSSRDFGNAVSTERDLTFARTHQPTDNRTLVSRSHTMASRLYPTFEIAQADSRWALSGISFEGEAITSRLHR